MGEHSRTVLAVRELLDEVGSIYPQVREQLPQLAFHSHLYGRHWDMLEWLLDGIEDAMPSEQRFLRMAEMGVACGPIGVHLLPRFPNLKYIGADPTITKTVHATYKHWRSRAKMYANTSEELHASLSATDQFDFVFIDGPHTYRNVRNDLEMWAPRIRPGGIIAGHDFTCAHPPLLWAVLEYFITAGVQRLNLGMDGVWWYKIE